MEQSSGSLVIWAAQRYLEQVHSQKKKIHNPNQSQNLVRVALSEQKTFTIQTSLIMHKVWKRLTSGFTCTLYCNRSIASLLSTLPFSDGFIIIRDPLPKQLQSTHVFRQMTTRHSEIHTGLFEILMGAYLKIECQPGYMYLYANYFAKCANNSFRYQNAIETHSFIQLLLLTPLPPHKRRSFYSILVSKRISCTFCEIVSRKISACEYWIGFLYVGLC